jgi:site-specific DNA-adenine methylase
MVEVYLLFTNSKNGFNVPMKSNFKDSSIDVTEEFNQAQKRFKDLNPTVLNISYKDISLEDCKNKVVVLDPPYEGSQAAYNTTFNYKEYWDFVKKVSKVAETVILFDTKSNIEKAGYKVLATRKMRVNGSKAGDVEAIAIIGKNLITE